MPPFHEPSCGDGGPAQADLPTILHGRYDDILQEPVPKELLLAGGVGSAGWSALKQGWIGQPEAARDAP